jgi:hypothetical protein
LNILGGLRKIKQGIWQYFGFLKNTVTFIYRLILITPPLQWWEIVPAALIGILVTWIVPMVKMTPILKKQKQMV